MTNAAVPMLLKLLLVPALVAAVTLAARRWGVRVGGVLTGLPMVAGPTLCFYAVEQGHDFAASAARAALLGIAATAAFSVVFAHVARRASWPLSVACAWLAFALVAALLYPVELGGAGELAIAVAGLLAGMWLLPRGDAVSAAVEPPRWDIPIRMIAAGAVVSLLTGLAAVVGEQASGIMAAFPTATVVLAAFTHAQRGHASVAVFLQGLLRGLVGFALFCIAFSLLLGTLGWNLLPAAAAALGVQLLWQLALLRSVTQMPLVDVASRTAGTPAPGSTGSGPV